MMATCLASPAFAAGRSTGRQQCRKTSSWQPAHLPSLRQRQRLVCKSGTEPNTTEDKQPAEVPATQANKPAAPPSQKSQLAKGQGTAIVTGAISIIFGVLYLALVQFMDVRGGELLPPPPEAYGP